MAWRSDKTMREVLKVFGSEQEIIVLDTETTGFSAEKNVIIQFSGIKFMISGGTLIEKERFDTYINPRTPLPERIIEVTGITDKTLASAPIEQDAFQKIEKFLGVAPVVCGQNIAFDIRFIKALYGRNNSEFSPKISLDTLEMARDMELELKDNKLGTLAAHYGVDYGLTFHNALDDVIACSRLLTVFKKEYEERAEAKKAVASLFTDKQKVTVKALRFWKGFRGHSRIYVQTNCGDFYYDIFKKVWGKGQNNCYELDMIDMESLKSDAFKFANACDEREFARFKG